MVKFDVSPAEAYTIGLISIRAESLCKADGARPYARAVVNLDVTACHANGCKLKLSELASARDSDFMHDILGIRRNIDRTTGRLRNSFVPRSALVEP